MYAALKYGYGHGINVLCLFFLRTDLFAWANTFKPRCQILHHKVNLKRLKAEIKPQAIQWIRFFVFKAVCMSHTMRLIHLVSEKSVFASICNYKAVELRVTIILIESISTFRFISVDWMSKCCFFRWITIWLRRLIEKRYKFVELPFLPTSNVHGTLICLWHLLFFCWRKNRSFC